jgi:hypothetical protein
MIAHLINKIKLDNRIRLCDEFMYSDLYSYFTGIGYFKFIINTDMNKFDYIIKYDHNYKFYIDKKYVCIKDNKYNILYSYPNIHIKIVIIKNRECTY